MVRIGSEAEKGPLSPGPLDSGRRKAVAWAKFSGEASLEDASPSSPELGFQERFLHRPAEEGLEVSPLSEMGPAFSWTMAGAGFRMYHPGLRRLS